MNAFNITIFAKRLNDEDRKYIGDKIETNFVRLGDGKNIPDDTRNRYPK